MEYVFNVKSTEKHDEELVEFEANSLEEAKELFADNFPEDVDNITCITRTTESGGVYEEIR